jgi:exo-beta-1,3-glucanase (GH17 family)
MKATTVPSLLVQSGDFDVQVQVNNKHHAVIVESQTPFRAVLKNDFEGYDIQTRHDSDDIVLPGYIEKIQSFYDGTPKVVTFQIQKYHWETGDIYEYNRPYHEKKCSMFSSILCPKDGVNIFSRKHGDLWKLATVSVVDEKMCFLVVHGSNAYTQILADEKPQSFEKMNDEMLLPQNMR